MNCKKINQADFGTEKNNKEKKDKSYVKWKGYDNSFNSCIDKKKKKDILYKMSSFSGTT